MLIKEKDNKARLDLPAGHRVQLVAAAERLLKEAGGQLRQLVPLAYRPKEQYENITTGTEALKSTPLKLISTGTTFSRSEGGGAQTKAEEL